MTQLVLTSMAATAVAFLAIVVVRARRTAAQQIAAPSSAVNPEPQP